MEGQIKSFPEDKTKGVHHHQALVIWKVKGTYLRKRSKLWTVKWQQTHNYQQLNLKQKQKWKTKQTTRTGTESQKWRSHGGISIGRGRMVEKVQGIRNIIGRYEIDGEVKNSIGNGEAKELLCTNHGHELRDGRQCWREARYRAEEDKGERMGQV